jgi:PAS domain S-box-containing protein
LNEPRFRSFLDRMQYAVIVVDPQWRCVYANPQATALAEHPDKDLIGKGLFDIMPVLATSRMEQELRRALTTQVAVSFEHLHPIRRLWFETSVYPSQRDVVIMIRDISDAKSAEERLRQDERELKDCFENAAVGLHWVGPDGRVLRVNEAELNMLGYMREEYVGHHVSEFHVDQQRCEDMLNRLAAQETLNQYEARLRCKDGSVKDVLISSNVMRENGRFMHTRCFTLDITRRKRWEMNQAELAAVVESSEDAIVIRAMDGTVKGWNPSATKLFGYKASEAIGQPFTFLLPPDRFNEERDILARLARGERVEAYETVRRRKDGREIDVSLSISPVKDDSGQVVAAAKVVRDITARKQAEAALQSSEERFRALAQANERLYEEAERANRLKDEFLATMSHELRTPLNSIFGWVRMVRTGMLDEAGGKRALESIEHSARAQVRLIDDLLDVSRIIMGKMRLEIGAVDLPTVVQAAADALAPTAELKGVRIEKILDPRAKTLSGDSDRLQQIIWNLISNSIKFTPKGGRVQVRLERVNSHVELTVSDTGEGIDPEFLPYVFDRFRQQESSTARRRGGLGLGLAIVRHLVELHGGVIHAYSPGKDQGATFTVRLPLQIINHPPRIPETSAPMVAVGGAGGGRPVSLDGANVLVVDDEVDARLLITNILKSYGARVTAVTSAAEAIKRLTQAREDLLVGDIEMPGEDGYALIKQIRALPDLDAQRIPAVALTAHARSEDRTRALTAGYDAHVAKPFEPIELVMVISRLIGRRVTTKP